MSRASQFKRARATLLFVGYLLLAGCEKLEQVEAPMPVRDFLLSTQQPEPGYGAYGYLLLTSRPSSASPNRYIALCAAYLRNLEPTAAAKGRTEKANLLPTYWFLVTKPQSQNCKEFVNSYDFTRAKALLYAVGKLAAQGPVLVAWRTPTPEANQQALVLDLSDFSDSDFDRAFRIWEDRIVRDPSIWNNGFILIRVREAFRNFIQQYGEAIVSLITSKT